MTAIVNELTYSVLPRLAFKRLCFYPCFFSCQSVY